MLSKIFIKKNKKKTFQFIKFLIYRFPEEYSLWDYRINTTTGNWESWSTIVDKFIFSPEDKYFDMQVPTVDTTKYGLVSE